MSYAKVIIIIIIIDIFLQIFAHQTLLVVFHWSMGNKNRPQVSRTLRSIVIDLGNVVVRVVTARPPISNCSNNLFKPLEIVRVL